jgi:hypothetical protein
LSAISKACARPGFPNNDRDRLAATLAIDLKCYSRLMGEYEAGTARWSTNIARRKMFPTRSL